MRVHIGLILSVLFLVLINKPLYSASSVCFKCHKQKDIYLGKYIHRPLRKKDCLTCHSPHVSKYKNLLKAEASDLCFSCHKKIEKHIKVAFFVHKPVQEKACLRCHLPHSSKYKGLLRGDVKDLCFKCHKSLLKRKQKFYHEPYLKGRCLACHDPHYGRDTRFLKSNNPDKICLGCHKKDLKFVRTHNNFKSVAQCLSCHAPHASNHKNLLREFFHQPFAQRKCNVCHKSKNNISMCLQCHKTELKSFSFYHNHLLGGYSRNTCLVCHNPHVGDSKSLLKDSPERLCASCHRQAYIQKKRNIYFHPQRKNCLQCHKGHGSNHPAMLNGDGNQVCVRCHKTQGKFTHPVGSKVLDPRNGQPVTCITCHEPMGTDFKYELKLSGEAALCLECHKNY